MPEALPRAFLETPARTTSGQPAETGSKKFRRRLARVGGSVLITMAVATAGCVQPLARVAAADRRPAALQIRDVAPGTELKSAEETASGHEGDFALAGIGASMAPYYRSGTALVVHPTSFFMLRRGMVVVYVNRQGRQIAHVLIESTPTGWVVAGLNNSEPDDERVTPVNLIGVVRCAFTSAGGVAAARVGFAAGAMRNSD